MSDTTKWRRDPHTGAWKATIGTWRGTVIRMTDVGDWYAYLERIAPPHDRHDGPRFEWASEGRAWCEAESIRLETQG